jgi:hypothetical protein
MGSPFFGGDFLDPGVAEARRPIPDLVKEYDNTWADEPSKPVDLKALDGGTYTDRFGLDWSVSGTATADVAQITSEGYHQESNILLEPALFALIPEMIATGGGPAYHKSDYLWLVVTYGTVTLPVNNTGTTIEWQISNLVDQRFRLMRWNAGGVQQVRAQKIDAGGTITRTINTAISDPEFSLDTSWMTGHYRYQQKSDPDPSQPSDVLNDMCTNNPMSIRLNGISGVDVKDTWPQIGLKMRSNPGATSVQKLERVQLYRRRVS